MQDDLENEDEAVRLWERLKPLLRVTAGLERLLNGIAIAGSVGVVLGFFGLVMLGMTGWLILLAFVFSALFALPPFFAWQGASAFGDLRDLPSKLRDLGQLPERAIEEGKHLALEAVTSGTIVTEGRKGLLRQARPVVKDLIGLVPIVVSIRSFNPVMLTGIAYAAGTSVMVTVCGTALFFLGAIF